MSGFVLVVGRAITRFLSAPHLIPMAMTVHNHANYMTHHQDFHFILTHSRSLTAIIDWNSNCDTFSRLYRIELNAKFCKLY